MTPLTCVRAIPTLYSIEPSRVKKRKHTDLMTRKKLENQKPSKTNPPARIGKGFAVRPVVEFICRELESTVFQKIRRTHCATRPALIPKLPESSVTTQTRRIVKGDASLCKVSGEKKMCSDC